MNERTDHGTREHGQTTSEYAAILSVLALATLLSFQLLGHAVLGTLQDIASFLASRGGT